jgi:hypothetical protein
MLAAARRIRLGRLGPRPRLGRPPGNTIIPEKRIPAALTTG